ncbi:OmpP1/FadL family transporter [Yoonia sp.]|uniref:OmpP1/FadL family transporter n=1 Tax=Yoonia sp. TaxID=2212373 RepID=UPI002FDB63ED
MKNVMTAGAALLLTTTSALALGLDRSGQPTGIIFEDGSYAEFSFGYVMPSLDGEDIDIGLGGGASSGNVGDAFSVLGLGYKQDINERISIAVIFDQPYGANVSYDPTGSVNLGGTAATVESNAVTGLVKYQIDGNWSVYGGLRAQTISADVTLAGAAFGPANGYNASFDSNTGFGYTLGTAYEIPDIALRVALTYHSEIEHSFPTTEFIPAGLGGFGSLETADTKVTTPQAINLDFQTGIAADTLLFGSIRWADYDVTEVVPELFGNSLTDLSTGTEYSIGVGRRFSDAFSGSVTVGYEAEGDDDLVSPLSPTNGTTSIAVGGQYTAGNITYSAGVSYFVFGDARPETSIAASEFTDNSAIAVGFRVGYRF